MRIRSYGNSFRACCSRGESRGCGEGSPMGVGQLGGLYFLLASGCRTGTPLHSPLCLQLQHKTIATPAPDPQAQDHCHPTAFPGTFSHPCLHPTTGLSKVVTWVLGSYRVINIAAVTSMEVPSILHFFFKAAEGGVAWGERRGSTEGEKGLCK